MQNAGDQQSAAKTVLATVVTVHTQSATFPSPTRTTTCNDGFDDQRGTHNSHCGNARPTHTLCG